MSRQSSEKGTPFNQRINEMHNLTRDIKSLFEEINSYKKKTSWKRKGLQDEQSLRDIIDRIIELGDQKLFKTFLICFGRTGMLSKFYSDDPKIKSKYKFSDELQTKIDCFKQDFENKLEDNNIRQRKALGVIARTLGKNKQVGILEAIKEGSSVTSEMQENINRLQDPIEIYVTHLNESVQHLAQLDIVLTKLVGPHSEISRTSELEKFRNEVRDMHTNLVHLLTDKNSPLMMTEVGSPIQRLQAFLDTTKFQAMQYGLADLKFRFTNEFKKELDDNSDKYADALGISKDAKISVYDYVREATGFNKLESNKTCVNTLESAKVNESTLNKVKNILNYMDGVVSVWSCIEKNKDTSAYFDRSKKKNIQGIVNGILLGLDSDLGLNKKLIDRFTDAQGVFDKNGYDAYLGGCIEECMVKNSPDIFKRDTKTESLGRFYVDKPPTKSLPIRYALGLSGETDEIDEKGFKFVNPEKLRVNALKELYERYNTLRKSITVGQMPIYLILAAIHPLDIQDRNKITLGEAKKIENKIGIYQSILKTLELGWTSRPRFGRARVMLDNTKSLGVQEEARGVFDRLLRFYQMHQPEIKQLKSHVIKKLQDENRERFGDFQTAFYVKGLKSIAHGLARLSLRLLDATPNALNASNQKVRQMHYKFLKGKTIGLVDEKDLNLNDSWLDGKFWQPPKYAKFKKDIANPANAFMRSKIDSVKNVHKQTKLENIYDELQIQDVIEDIRLIKSLGSSTMLEDAEAEKNDIKEKYMEECKSLYAGEPKEPSNEKFAGYRQFMEDRFEEAYAQIDTIPKYMSKYDSVTELLNALDMQKDSQSEKYEEEKKKIEYLNFKGVKTLSKPDDLTEALKEEQRILSQVAYTAETSIKLKELLNTIYDSLKSPNSNFEDVQQKVSDIRKVLENRGDWSKEDTKKMVRASTRVTRQEINSISSILSSDSQGLQGENQQFMSEETSNPNVITNDTEVSSNRSRAYSMESLVRESIFTPPNSIREEVSETNKSIREYVDDVIAPLRKDLKELKKANGDGSSIQALEAELTNKLSKWNEAHPEDQFRYKGDNYSIERVSSPQNSSKHNKK